MELWDAYNEKFEKIEGVTLTRGEQIPEGMFCLVCDVLVRHTDGTYLLMQRDKNKLFGGMWEATSGGAALKGENPRSCAERELQEETGIKAENLQEVARDISFEISTIFVEYLCVTDHKKDKITLQEGETVAYKWVTKEELISMRNKKQITKRTEKYIGSLK